jgi:hypothetical protein
MAAGAHPACAILDNAPSTGALPRGEAACAQRACARQTTSSTQAAAPSIHARSLAAALQAAPRSHAAGRRAPAPAPAWLADAAGRSARRLAPGRGAHQDEGVCGRLPHRRQVSVTSSTWSSGSCQAEGAGCVLLAMTW